MADRERGRPSKLTTHVQEALVTAIESGASYRLACQYAGISYSVFRLWQRKGEEAEEEEREDEFLHFLNAIKKAEANCAIGQLNVIQAHGIESWQASAWILERRFPEDYGRRDRVKITTDDEGDIDREIERELAKLEAGKKAADAGKTPARKRRPRKAK